MQRLAEMPDIVAEAMRRRGRQRYTPRPNLRNNYLAERRSSRGRGLRKSVEAHPAAAPKRKAHRTAGAPRGNRNALKSGLYSGEMKALRQQVRMRIARLKLATAQAKLLAVQLGR